MILTDRPAVTLALYPGPGGRGNYAESVTRGPLVEGVGSLLLDGRRELYALIPSAHVVAVTQPATVALRDADTLRAWHAQQQRNDRRLLAV